MVGDSATTIILLDGMELYGKGRICIPVGGSQGCLRPSGSVVEVGARLEQVFRQVDVVVTKRVATLCCGQTVVV